MRLRGSGRAALSPYSPSSAETMFRWGRDLLACLFRQPSTRHGRNRAANMPNNAPPPVTLGQVSEGRRNNLDFLRFALATLVVLAHSFGLPGYAAHEPITLLTRGQYNGGPLAVDFFFIISGF